MGQNLPLPTVADAREIGQGVPKHQQAARACSCQFFCANRDLPGYQGNTAQREMRQRTHRSVWDGGACPDRIAVICCSNTALKRCSVRVGVSPVNREKSWTMCIWS
jgi:hypothetical protein